MAGDVYRNFRLRGIPASAQSRSQVRDLVKAALKLAADTKLEVHSLARNPLELSSRVATLTFGDDDVPALFDEIRTEWMVAIPDCDEDEAEKWGPRKLVFDTHFRGFTPLHRADDSECVNDLIAISGLAGHAFGSFKARGSDFMWLRDDLPFHLRQTRIMIYGYDTKVVASSSFQNLNDLGNMFRYSIQRLQFGTTARCRVRPTIFLGHSLGGLIVKEAMIKMKASSKIEDRDFLDNIIAFMFFGVPHQGMTTEHLVPMVGNRPNRALIESLGKHSAILQRYEAEFPATMNNKTPPEILSFYETEMSPTATFNEDKQVWQSDRAKLSVLVDRSSATTGSSSQYAIARNHSEMVKFTNGMDDMYDVVLGSFLSLMRSTNFLSTLLPNQRECLQSLSFDEQHLRQTEIHDADNTCAWLLEDLLYQRWMDQPRGLLWIKGKPGAGKSVLMKFAFEKMRERLPQPGSNQLVASFFIHGRGVNLQKKPAGVFRALLHELIPHFNDVLAQATTVFEERQTRRGSYREGRWEWTEGELETFLLQVLTSASAKQPVVIFIDALDECEKDAPVRLLTCLKRFGEKVEQNSSHARICFSSRHYPILGQARVPTILVEEKNREDIRQVMKERLKEIEPEEERQQIVSAISSRGKGVFQWAVLVAAKAVEKHLRGFNVRVLRKQIEILPAELDSLYAGLLDEVNGDEDEKTEAIKLFRWVFFACRPLSVRELREALATDPHVSYATIAELREHDNYARPAERFERRVVDMSKGLIEFKTRDVWESLGPDDEGDNRQAEFIHQSVPDYLLEYFLKPTEVFEDTPQSSAGRGHFELSRSCLRYLGIQEILFASGQSREAILMGYPLVEYAIRYFFSHIQRAEAEQINQADLMIFLRWDEKTKKEVAALWRTFDSQSSYSPVNWPFLGGNVLHVLAASGSLSGFKAALHQNGIEVDSRDRSNNNPLLIAIRETQDGIALELLGRSIKWMYRHSKATGNTAASLKDAHSLPSSAKGHFVDADAVNDELETPMSVAVSNGASEVILALIEAGASLEVMEPVASPVLYAIRTNNQDLLHKLIQNGAKLNGAVYYTAAWMSRIGNREAEKLIRILLDAGADTRSTCELIYYATEEFYDDDNDGPQEVPSRSALQIAAEREHLPIIQLILSSGSNPPEEVHDAFIIAAENGNVPIAGSLLRQESELKIPRSELRYAFTIAARNGNLPMVELLLDHETEKNTFHSEMYHTIVVSMESKKAASNVAELFLNYGAKRYDFISAVMEKGNVPMVCRLLDYTDGDDVFVAATTEDNIGIAEVCLSHGRRSISVAQDRVHIALEDAIRLRRVEMARLLLHYGAKSGEFELGTLQKTLQFSIESGNIPMADLLFDIGVDIIAPEVSKHSLLYAVAQNNMPMVEMLLDKAIDIEGTSETTLGLATPLLVAVSYHNVSMVELLLSRGADPNKGNDAFGGPLYYALEEGCYLIARRLLSRGASLNSDHFSPLARAASKPDFQLVEVLIANGASLDNIDGNGLNAIGEALRLGDECAIRVLAQTVATMVYNDSLTWPPEYPTVKQMVGFLIRNGIADFAAGPSGIVSKAILRGNQELVEFMVKYVRVGSDFITKDLSWYPGSNPGANLPNLRTKLSNATNPSLEEGVLVTVGAVAPIVVAVAFKRVSMVQILLDIGKISKKSLIQASFLASALGLHEILKHFHAKRPELRDITPLMFHKWPFLRYNPKDLDRRYRSLYWLDWVDTKDWASLSLSRTDDNTRGLGLNDSAGVIESLSSFTSVSPDFAAAVKNHHPLRDLC